MEPEQRRILIADTPKLIGKDVVLKGWVHIRRDHGKLIFIDLRDRSGVVQMVVIPGEGNIHEVAKKVRPGFTLEIQGFVKQRPQGSKKEDDATGGVEIEVKEIKILSRPAQELPLDISQEDMDLNLETLLDNRHLTLRNLKIQAIFKVLGEVFKSYSEKMRAEGFQEIKTPNLLNSATEGGANFFKVKYFDKEAFLAQSPQFYKQAGVGEFERVFVVGPVFRAEQHFTSRHVNEFTGLDAEMGFINSYKDVMDQLEETIWYMMEQIGENCQKELKMYGAKVPEKVEIPRISLQEAGEILKKEYGKEIEGIDIDPEGERLICEWAKKKYNSDFIFLTQYPTSVRPFYAMPNEENSQFTDSFDLLFRGVEIVTGGQRIHDYDQMKESMKHHGLDPKDFKDYLDIFKNGIPPHGGWGFGAERVVQKLLGLDNIKQAVLYPRDVKRLTP